ncbi:MAG: hypothetical protein JW840_01815 [Candidatus Thermoplasmatota archaeon]|nr:hypothetical protein [Candidatus Thermoplasmatota archaeon]
MTKWKLFNRSKTEEHPYPEGLSQKEEKKKEKEKQTKPETTNVAKEKPIKEYNETLYSKDTVKKEQKTTFLERKTFKRTSWENAETIEHNVDHMRQKHPETRGIKDPNRETTDKKVDLILLKKKRKI